MSGVKYVDAHCHFHEFSPTEAAEHLNTTVIVAVSDDVESSRRTLQLAERLGDIVPCVGVHPWHVEEADSPEEVLKEIEKMVTEYNVKCLGEIGLDKIFAPKTFNTQIKFFKLFVQLAVEYDLAVNLHTPGAWREAYDIIRAANIERAIFHWYSGPLDLLDKIVDSGYFITANPCIDFEKKHRKAVERIPLENLLTESDGPYEYRGLRLSPALLPKLTSEVAKIKGVEEEELLRVLHRNLERFLGQK